MLVLRLDPSKTHVMIGDTLIKIHVERKNKIAVVVDGPRSIPVVLKTAVEVPPPDQPPCGVP